MKQMVNNIAYYIKHTIRLNQNSMAYIDDLRKAWPVSSFYKAGNVTLHPHRPGNFDKSISIYATKEFILFI